MGLHLCHTALEAVRCFACTRHMHTWAERFSLSIKMWV